jgi:hypothetical protein
LQELRESSASRGLLDWLGLLSTAVYPGSASAPAGLPSRTSGYNGLDVDEREHRLTQNEALFREVNERLENVAHRLGPEVPYEFLCECANADCTFRITLPLSVYETVRADPKQFVVLPLHYTPEIEELVVEDETYWIVRKSGEAGEYVEDLDPRSR